MDTERLVFIIAATFGLDYRICTPTRDMQAEGALTRALARNGGDGLTDCHEDAGVCPKPYLRHRRVNVGIWPNWRCRKYRRWDFESENCAAAFRRLGSENCGTYQDHIDLENRKAWLADLVKRHQSGAPVELWKMAGDEFGLTLGQLEQLLALARQARNISDNMGIGHRLEVDKSGLFYTQPYITDPPDTTWYAQYPEQVWNERSEPQWTVTSTAPRPFEGKTYRFDPISITDLLPDESLQPSSSHAQPSPVALLPPPSPDSEA